MREIAKEAHQSSCSGIDPRQGKEVSSRVDYSKMSSKSLCACIASVATASGAGRNISEVPRHLIVLHYFCLRQIHRQGALAAFLRLARTGDIASALSILLAIAIEVTAERIAFAAGTSRLSHSIYSGGQTQDAVGCVEAALIRRRGENLRDGACIASTCCRETVVMRPSETSVNASRVAAMFVKTCRHYKIRKGKRLGLVLR